MSELPTVRTAEMVAEQYLSSLGNRWLHTQAVAIRAEELAVTVPPADQTMLIVAAWWHDLGYAEELKVTGFHPLDGANFLMRQGYSLRLCAFVAHHSGATFEADERGLLNELNIWPQEEGPVSDALWTADMTTGPDGTRLDFSARLKEILGRYEADSAVGRAMRRARPEIQKAIDRTHARLQAIR